MRPDRIALFGYAHVPHLIPRQRRIDAANLPDAEARFRGAEAGYLFLTAAGYEPVGFDHFALPRDPLAIAARLGTLRRNFQGFTDDSAETLIGLGASAISSFPDRLVQNEKNAGRYRMLVSGGHLPAARGSRRTPRDMLHGRIIEDLLCSGAASIGGACIAQAIDCLPFERAGLLRLSGSRIMLTPAGLPYARAIAAAFDPYRQANTRRFSSAV
jgi:oxygen-independent coproporphyrinogen-3 oxidase